MVDVTIPRSNDNNYANTPLVYPLENRGKTLQANVWAEDRRANFKKTGQLIDDRLPVVRIFQEMKEAGKVGKNAPCKVLRAYYIISPFGDRKKYGEGAGKDKGKEIVVFFDPIDLDKITWGILANIAKNAVPKRHFEIGDKLEPVYPKPFKNDRPVATPQVIPEDHELPQALVRVDEVPAFVTNVSPVVARVQIADPKAVGLLRTISHGFHKLFGGGTPPTSYGTLE